MRKMDSGFFLSNLGSRYFTNFSVIINFLSMRLIVVVKLSFEITVLVTQAADLGGHVVHLFFVLVNCVATVVEDSQGWRIIFKNSN